MRRAVQVSGHATSHRDRWDQIGDFGPMVMPLDQAEDYIAKDPMGCFWP
jgi:hypothetical protein